ncbi:MAG: hypothetical protein AMJ75_05640 [Phycisphaerae bacterium SM1_79]|nr:MAG: hypothetical protein AMJ75_05640 [Phycisphaerae bacterium SM1_79]
MNIPQDTLLLSRKGAEFFENLCLQKVTTNADFSYIETEKMWIIKLRKQFPKTILDSMAVFKLRINPIEDEIFNKLALFYEIMDTCQTTHHQAQPCWA